MKTNKCKECPYKDECLEACINGYCLNNEGEVDFSTALYAELQEQNGEL